VRERGARRVLLLHARPEQEPVRKPERLAKRVAVVVAEREPLGQPERIAVAVAQRQPERVAERQPEREPLRESLREPEPGADRAVPGRAAQGRQLADVPPVRG